MNHGLILVLILTSFSTSLFADESYFLSSYDESRSSFLSLSKSLLSKGTGESGKFQVASDKDEKLYTDYVYLPPKFEPKHLIILISGVHGIETFATSAIQRMFMSDVLPNLDRENTGYLIIHALNPYGFKFGRRVTEYNVDLNRNFILNWEEHKDHNDKYSNFDDFLNPKTKVSAGFIPTIVEASKALIIIAKESISSFRQAVVQGQYKFPKGIFYGGEEAESQVFQIKDVIQNYAKNFKKVLAIDLHTGYGEKGVLHFFGIPKYDEKIKGIMDKVFEGYKIDSGNDKNFYTTTGDSIGFLSKILPSKIVVPMTFEYGTMNSQSLKGSLESLLRVKRENQGVHFGYNSKSDEVKIKNDFKLMFCPKDSEWREQVMRTSKEIFPKVINRFIKI